jgi:hypothetical protein
MSETIQSFTQSNHSYCTVKDRESSKSVTDTPETDAMLDNQSHDDVKWDDACDQLAELCRSLEGKLREAIDERDEARLQYRTTLVFCQSLVKERLEEMEMAGE